MFNIITSAGTAAKKRSKCSLFARHPLLLAILLLCAVSSCHSPVIELVSSSKSKEKEFNEAQHNRFRTLWYRTNERCFYDSCRKYGLLVNRDLGITEANINRVDTIPLHEIGVCK